MTESRTLSLSRVAALVAGFLVLIGATVLSSGLALAAPLGVWIVHRIQRARGHRLGLGDSWLGAVSAATLALIVVAAVMAIRLPSGTLSHLRQVADSASSESARQPPPAWLSRIAPRSATRYAAASTTLPSGFNALILIWTLGMSVGLLGGLAGTVGWGGTMLVVFYASGHWPRGSPPPAVVID